MKKIIIFGMIFVLIAGLVIAGVSFSNHQQDKSKCNIDSSWCKIAHICPSKDVFCEDNRKYASYVIFYKCEFYTGSYNKKDEYCEFYNKNFTRNYPFDIHKYDKYSKGKRDYDQLKESIKNDIKNIIEKEQGEKQEEPYEDRSGDKSKKYNRKGNEN